MANVKIKNIEAIRKNVEKKIKSFKSDQKEMDKAAKTIQNQMRTSLRNGKHSDSKGGETDMPSIAPKTVERRRKMSETNKTHKSFSANKSNITFSGDLVQKLFAKAKSGKITLFGKGQHKKLRGTTGKTLKQATIKDIMRGLYDKGWRILFVPEKAKTKIAKQFKEFLRRK